MNRISDARLESLIEWWGGGTKCALRELRDYRKAVRKYLEAWNADDNDADSMYERSAELRAALRALAQPEQEKYVDYRDKQP